MEKKSKKTVAKVVMVLFALMMVFALTGCKSKAGKMLDSLDKLISQLEKTTDLDKMQELMQKEVDLIAQISALDPVKDWTVADSTRYLQLAEKWTQKYAEMLMGNAAGSYKIVSLTERDGWSVPPEEFGIIRLVLNKNGTGTLINNGKENNLVWDGITNTMASAGEAGNYSLAGNKLTWYTDSGIAVFTKE